MRHLFSSALQQDLETSKPFHVSLAAISIVGFSSILSQGPGWAQLTPDTTLGSESSVVVRNVTINGLLSDRIDGGAVRGSNLFHSFDAFNVSAGQGVYFANPTGVETIVNRVTGNTATDILGTLGSLGNADVFLINPNGILFGPDAQLDLGGSFVASTANRIDFTDGLQFSATKPQSAALLTISTPIGLHFGTSPGSIQVQGSGHTLRTENNSPNDPIVSQGPFMGLAVPMGETLALIGGNVSLEGGNIRAEAGRIELGGVGDNSRVSLSSIPTGWAMEYGDTSRFSDVKLSQAASVDTNGAGAGSIHIQGQQISLTEASIIQANTLDSQSSGMLQVNATEQIELIGSIENTPGGLFARTFGTGQAANVTVTAPRLLAQDGSRISAASYGEGNAGNLTINASESVEVVGTTTVPPLSGFFVNTLGTGNAGELTINTQTLTVQDGGQVSAATTGAGEGGRLTVNASEAVKVIGIAPNQGRFSNLNTLTGGNQPAGNLTIRTGTLVVQDGARITTLTTGNGRGGELVIVASEAVEVTGFDLPLGNFRASLIDSSTFGNGQAGNFLMETERLRLQDGGQVSASTFAEGDAGDFTINASVIEVIGEADNGLPSGIFAQVNRFGTGNAGGLRINTDHLKVKDGALISASATGRQGTAGTLEIHASEFMEVAGIGPFSQFPSAVAAVSLNDSDAGNLNIETEQLTVQDGAEVIVAAFGTGAAGNLNVEADLLRIENNSRLSAETNAGRGNIILQTGSLQLFRNSNITTNATGEAGGGNITITTDTLTAFENSDITANAVAGPGGNIQITTQALFQSSDSDITASSELGVDGVVDLQEIGTDPEQGLVELPASIIDPNTLIANSCLAPSSQKQGRFRVVGAGGLQTLPNDLASSPFPTLAVPPAYEAATSTDLIHDSINIEETLEQITEPIIEAHGAYQLEDDSLVFGRMCHD